MAHIDLSRSYAVAELNGSGGIDRRNLSDGKCRIRDIINFRIKSDGSLEKRCGFTSLSEFSEKIRAEYVLSDELMFVLAGGQIYRVFPKTGAASLEKEIASSESDACFFNYNGTLYLLDGNEIYAYDGTTFVEVEGYVPLYTKNWTIGTTYSVNEPLNLLSNRVRVHFIFGGVIPAIVSFPFYIASIDAIYVNGAFKSSSKLFSINTFSARSINIDGSFDEGDEVTLFLSLDKSSYPQRSTVANMSHTVCFGNGKGKSEFSSIVFYGGDESDKLMYARHVSDEELTEVRKIYTKALPIYVTDDDCLHTNFSAGITAVVPCSDSLMIFGADSTYILEESFSKPASLSRSMGCFINGGAIPIENSAITMSRNGIFRWDPSAVFDNEYSVKCISLPVSELISYDVSEGAIYHYAPKNEYWFHYGGTDRVLIYNTVLDIWYCFGGFSPDRFFEINGSMGFVSGNTLYLFDDQASDDDGLPISARIESSIINFGDFNRHKKLARAMIKMSPNHTVAFSVTDAKENSTELSLSDSSGERLGYIERRVPCLRSRYYSVSLTHDSDESNVVIYSITMSAAK